MRRLLWAILSLSAAACGDGTPEEALPQEGQPGAPVCRDDGDGVVEAGELTFSPGLEVPYAVQRKGDRSGEPAGDPASGEGLWDFSNTDFDRLETLDILAPEDQWYAGLAPAAQVAVRFGAGEDAAHLLLSVSDDEVAIVGLASVTPEVQKLAYDAPAPFLRFPMTQGRTYSGVVHPLAGSVYQGFDLSTVGLEDTYTVKVAGGGTLKLPGATLEHVQAVELSLSRRLRDEAPTVVSQTFLVHECLGTVAWRTEPDEPWWVVYYPE